MNDLCKRSQDGFVLVTALLIGLLLSAVAFLAAMLSTQLSSEAVGHRDVVAVQQLADGAGNQIRSKLAEDFRQSALTRHEWLRRLLLNETDPLSRYRANRDRPDLQPFVRLSPATVRTDPARFWDAPGLIRLSAEAPAEIYGRIFATPGLEGETQVLEVRTTAYLRSANQTILRRLQGEMQEVFDFALVSRGPNCQFCHLQVQGNVGALSHLRPGFLEKTAQQDIGYDEATGSTPSGNFSGWGDGNRLGDPEDSGPAMTDNWLASGVRGDLYAYLQATNDKSDFDPQTGRASRLNGVVLDRETGSGAPHLYTGHFGARFQFWRGADVDGNGRFDDFAPLDRAALERQAKGSIAGEVQAVSFGAQYAPAPGRRLNGVIDGHAVLTGEMPGPENNYCRSAVRPLEISGEIFVRGDIVIRGCIHGRGHLYSGRNLYIAGDVVYVDPPGTDGNYTAAQDPDEAARNDLKAGKDSLALAANGSIVIGDYTETNPSLARDQSGGRYLRSRFRLSPGTKVPLRRENNLLEELITDRAGKYRTLSGAIVPAEGTIPGEGYDALIRPAPIRPADPASSPWLSDDRYLAILDRSVPGGAGSVSTWRIDVRGYRLPTGESLLELARSGDPAKVAACREFFFDNLKFGTGTAAERDATARAQAIVSQLQSGIGGWSEAGFNFLGTGGGHDGKAWILETYNRQPAGQGFEYGVLRPTQVQRVDGFLYSARRIGGLVNGTNLVINGGVAAPEVGLTAVGVGDAQARWTGDTTLRNRLTAKGDQNNPFSGTSYKYGAIHFDYRLRNGGQALRFVSRLNAAEQIDLQTHPSTGSTSYGKVCRNLRCD